MYGDVVLGLKPESKEEEDPFEEIIDEKKKARGIKLDTEFTVDDLKDLVTEFKAAIKAELNIDFPEDPMEQLWGAIGAVFKSWKNERAITYRKLNNIPASWGTAVNVQSMVFGNMGRIQAPALPSPETPRPVRMSSTASICSMPRGRMWWQVSERPCRSTRSRRAIPRLPCSGRGDARGIRSSSCGSARLSRSTSGICRTWSSPSSAGNSGCSRQGPARRTAFADFKIAVDMVKEGLINKEEALMRVSPDGLNQILRPIFDPEERSRRR